VRTVPAVLVAALLLAACGPMATRQPAGEWTSNAKGVIAQLRGDVLEISGADRLPAARAALHDDAQLYGLLVAFSDVGGCAHMVSSLGTRPGGRARTLGLLDRACGHLRTAGALFTRANGQNDAPALVAAAQEALAALPLLDRAALALHPAAT
jgi:hypothetical protein